MCTGLNAAGPARSAPRGPVRSARAEFFARQRQGATPPIGSLNPSDNPSLVTRGIVPPTEPPPGSGMTVPTTPPPTQFQAPVPSPVQDTSNIGTGDRRRKGRKARAGGARSSPTLLSGVLIPETNTGSSLLG